MRQHKYVDLHYFYMFYLNIILKKMVFFICPKTSN